MFKFLLVVTNYTLKSTNGKFHKFMDLVKPPLGSKVPITSQQKKIINQQINKRMQELEDTGLSRQQILLSKSQKGLPLKLDPFFQFLKHNYMAREVYLKQSDRYTAQKVIDIALRQDIGPDPSYSRIRQPNIIQSKGRAQLLQSFSDRPLDAFDPDSYYANKQFSNQRAYSQLKKTQPVKHIYKPIDRYNKLKDHLRKIKKYDIHWRNIQLLRQFVSKNGNIRNRTANLLSAQDQKRISKSIRTARAMGVMPHYGRTPEPLKKNITTLEDEVQQLGYQHVNIQTGHLYFSRSRSMDKIQADLEKATDLDNKYNKMISQGTNYRIWVQSIQEPIPQEVEKAQGYARYLKENQNKLKNRKNINQIKQKVLRNITGFDASIDRQLKFQTKSDEESKSAFQSKKKRISEKLRMEPLFFSEILLKEKIQL